MNRKCTKFLQSRKEGVRATPKRPQFLTSVSFGVIPSVITVLTLQSHVKKDSILLHYLRRPRHHSPVRTYQPAAPCSRNQATTATCAPSAQQTAMDGIQQQRHCACHLSFRQTRRQGDNEQLHAEPPSAASGGTPEPAVSTRAFRHTEQTAGRMTVWLSISSETDTFPIG